MRNTYLKYLLISFVLLAYVNRGLLVSATESERGMAVSTHQRGEINSMLELLRYLATGYENGVDEDGDSPESYNFAPTQPLTDYCQAHSINLNSLLTRANVTVVPLTERIPSTPTYGTVDRPPEAV